MPRKFASSLTVVPLVPGHGRPGPPADLDSLEQRVWRDVVAALPEYWIYPAGQVVVRRLAAQTAVRQEMRLLQLNAQEQDNRDEDAGLTVANGAVAKTVDQLLVQPFNRAG